MSIKKELEDHLRSWRSGIVKVVASKQSWIPERFSTRPLSEGKVEYSLQEPICFGSLPLGSSMSRKQPKVWVFIDGWFHVAEDGDKEKLISFGAAISFFEAKPKRKRFRLLDAFHFDFHFATEPSSPHPLFHTQRNIRWDVGRWKKSLDRGQFAEVSEYSFADQSGVKALMFRLSRFRVPTARIDVFAAMLATLADMVIQHDVDEHCAVFNFLVDLTAGAKNPLHRLVKPQPEVPNCFDHAHSSAHIWYPRFTAPAAGQ